MNNKEKVYAETNVKNSIVPVPLITYIIGTEYVLLSSPCL